MTPLERARQFLLERQLYLSIVRARASDYDIDRCEDAVLAALSWVWEEQEKENVIAISGHASGARLRTPPPPKSPKR